MEGEAEGLRDTLWAPVAGAAGDEYRGLNVGLDQGEGPMSQRQRQAPVVRAAVDELRRQKEGPAQGDVASGYRAPNAHPSRR